MIKDDIIRMACDAHGPITGRWWDMDVAALERFAKLVAAAEREACAKECEHTALRMGSEWMAQHCAEAIRARGQK